MANYTGPERSRDDAISAPVDARTQDQFKAIIRWGLTLSSVAMTVFAALTYFGVLPFPRWTAFMFIAVAAIDTVIAFVVFGPAKH